VQQFVEEAVKQMMVSAQRHAICPTCLLFYASAYLVANILLREEAVIGAAVQEKAEEMLETLSGAAIHLAVDLAVKGEFWAVEAEKEAKVH